MRRLFLFTIIGIMFILKLDAQTYLISTYNNQTISSCSGNFYDSGGPSGGYGTGESYVVTFAPATSGSYTNMTFSSFSVGIGDMLEVFDGPNVSSTLIGVFNNGNSPVGVAIRASLFNFSGKLTFRWTSVHTGAGWAAAVSCGLPCQDFNSLITSSTPPFVLDSGRYLIDICPGDTVTLHASANFPYNNFYYHQDTSTTSFSWNFNGQNVINGQNITAVFNNTQGYNAFIVAIDTNGCRAQQTTEVRIRVSTPPVFAGTDIPRDTVCQYDSTLLQGKVETTHWQIVPSLSVAGVTYLPDGSGVSYTSNLTFSGFNPGQTIQQVSDITRIFMDIEHSYLGDLNIVIKCPNNSSITLKSFPGGTNTFLGEPIDNNSQPIPGLGYMYYWAPSGTTTMLNAAGSYFYSYTDVNGNSYTDHPYLPPSPGYPPTSTATTTSGVLPTLTYLPETPFTNLVGCPLNGIWKIIVTDNLNIDNGFIFSWGLDFNPSVMPVSWGYTPVVDTTYWTSAGMGDTTYYKALNAGLQNVVYNMVDGAGCHYDTTISLLVNPVPPINLGNDTSVCIHNAITINSGNSLQGVSFNWNTGSADSSITVQVDSTERYYLTATSPLGCINDDSILVSAVPLPNIVISDDTLICIGTQASLFASGGNVYLWSTGSTNNSIQVSPISSQRFSVTVTDTNLCVSDSSTYVTVAPLPTVALNNDTTICENTSLHLWASGGQQYHWSNGVNQATQLVSPVVNQTYTVVVEDHNRCVDSAQVEVSILQLPIAQVFSNYDTLCRGGMANLRAEGGMTYQWSNGVKSQSINVQPLETKRYVVNAINTENGTHCYDTASYRIVVEHCVLYTPSAFTPNGDGLNDTFGPLGLVSNTATFEFIIFDRSGSVVFKTSDRFAQWDGKVKGQIAPDGVYSYVIRVSEPSIKPYQVTGTVTLYR